MTDSLFKVRYRTDLYEWGKGWLSMESKNRWDKWLEDFVDYGWSVIKPKSSGDCYRIASVYSLVYLHPMSGLVTLENEKEVERLRVFLTNLCAAAGGTLKHYAAQEVKYELEV